MAYPRAVPDSMRVPPAFMPTAVQAAAVAHDTPSRMLPGPGLGLGTTDHLVPFQDSMRVAGLPEPELVEPPTAVQAAADRHCTLASVLCPDPGLGLGTWDQLVPFHDSMRVLLKRLVPCSPTAVHAAADTHDTLVRGLLNPGLGLGTTDHVVPFQDSTRVPAMLAVFFW